MSTGIHLPANTASVERSFSLQINNSLLDNNEKKLLKKDMNDIYDRYVDEKTVWISYYLSFQEKSHELDLNQFETVDKYLMENKEISFISMDDWQTIKEVISKRII